MAKIPKKTKITIGWKEWYTLDSIGLVAIKAKTDTGAKTSALHAFNIESFYIEDVEYVKFDIHPLQKNKRLVRNCIARVVDQRMVSDSGGKKEKRYVIKTDITIKQRKVNIEITLTNRDSMAFRMLLGREAIMQINAVVDPTKSFICGVLEKKEVSKLYKKSPQSKDPRTEL